MFLCLLGAGGVLAPSLRAEATPSSEAAQGRAAAPAARSAASLGPGAWCVHAGAPSLGAPLIDRRGRVVMATTDGYVHSFERRGRYRWSYTLSGAVAGPVAQRSKDGAIWVGTTDRQLYSIATDGRLQGRITTAAPVATGLVRRRDGSLLYGSGRALYATTAFGGARWRVDLGAALSGPPVQGSENITWVAAGRELLRVEGAWRLQRFPLPGEALGPPLRLAQGVAIVAGGDLLSFDDAGQLRWPRGDVAVAAVAGRGVVGVSPRGQVRWFDADGQQLKREGPASDAGGHGGVGAPAASPQVLAGVTYVPLLSGELVGVDRQGQVVRRWRLSTAPLGELAIDVPGRRLLATVSGGRICSVPLVE